MGEFIELIKSDKYPKFKFSDAAKVVSESNLLALDQAILRQFLKFGSRQLGEKEKEKFDYIKGLATLENPIHWFPQARKMKRKIIMHVGPTNSGKTYKALQRLKTAPRGVYCGPLRLLAFEIFKRFIDEGIRCNLATGEERIDVEDYISNLEKTTATIEMLNLSKVYDVAVFDEIQLLSDAQRGWGWLRALVGVQAHEIHLCGEPSAIPFVKEICKQMNEEVIINEYERLSPLKIKEDALDGDYKKFKKGDCLVTFSRDGIFEHKDKVEKATGLKCAVVYGRLPPENRAMEAKLFNDPDSGYDIMVASDAVGMGLNLNIQRVVFDSLSKFDGTGIRKVKISQVKQIAGRAGRFGTHFANGEVTSFYKTDVDYLLYCMQQKFAPLKTIGLQPELSILKAFFYQFPNESFSMILIKLMVLCELPKGYFLCYTDDHIKLAGILSEIPLSLEDRLSFLMAPIPARDPQVVKFIAKAITTHSQGHPVNIKDHLNIPNTAQMNDEDYLKQLETCHRCIMLYLWLR
ncbi:P-loop containing nucleoside triphosphate hydrolase protein [Neoconidiobolus thromboides FSU 785]|nr:P-loop containing nucleoside triphosphate hydrolase protein [Neoconidiobolus thromboides FSU 785]